VPLVLTPLLAPGARGASRAERALGAALFLGPAALGMAVILVLAPAAVWDNVVTYHSTRGFFGLAGMVREFADFDVRFSGVTLVAAVALAALTIVWRARRPLALGEGVLLAEVAVTVLVLWLVEAADRTGVADARGAYATVFALVLGVAAVATSIVLWRGDPPTAPRLFLLAAVALMIVVAFGPGYGPQYAYWFLPALVATYVLLDDGWRWLLRVAWLVAAVTYVVEYALVDYLGAWAAEIFGDGTWVADAGNYLKAPHHLVVARLPLYAVYLVLIAAGVDRLHRHARPRAASESARGATPAG
jgi:hypothetical protein